MNKKQYNNYVLRNNIHIFYKFDLTVFSFFLLLSGAMLALSIFYENKFQFNFSAVMMLIILIQSFFIFKGSVKKFREDLI